MIHLGTLQEIVQQRLQGQCRQSHPIDAGKVQIRNQLHRTIMIISAHVIVYG